MTKPILAVLWVLGAVPLRAQERFIPGPRYMGMSHVADSLLKAADYAGAARKYDTLLEIFSGGSRYDRFQAACAWAQAGDSSRALDYLEQAATPGNWAPLSRLLAAPALASLRVNSRWRQLVSQAETYRTAAASTLFRPMSRRLDSLRRLTEAGEARLDSFRAAFGPEAARTDSVAGRVRRGARQCAAAIREMLITYGWLGALRVGPRDADFFFRVVMTSDATIRALALPALREAVSRGGASLADFARLEDRVLVDAGKPQIYGTQFFTNATGSKECYPLEEPARVDQLRTAAGLPPLAGFTRRVGIGEVDRKDISPKTASGVATKAAGMH